MPPLVWWAQTRRPAVVPNLQHLPPDWTGQDVDYAAIRALLLPVPVLHPIEKVEVDTYFYMPPQVRQSAAEAMDRQADRQA